ncbi:DUF2214 family protein [Cellvibrio mixtus]|uniref:DUF2214 family protein n=1 Tax=Cellvibrio mixtus TaxID=39650 RepID=UPI000694CEB4|nr:DUF2214 family protein [Cellvibrio mixtus]
MINSLLVYIHLLAACVAIGILLIQDYALFQTHGRRLTTLEIAELHLNAKRVSIALLLLWVTGIAIVIKGYIGHPDYIINQKLWAKLSVVVVLTVNGYLLHNFCFPRLCKPQGLNELSSSEKVLLALAGSLSTTSWLYASYLGIARHWSFSVNYTDMMAIYAGTFLMLFIIACQCLWYFSKVSQITQQTDHLTRAWSENKKNIEQPTVQALHDTR